MNKFKHFFSIIIVFTLSSTAAYSEEYLVVSNAYVPFKLQEVNLVVQFDTQVVSAKKASAQEIRSAALKENYILGGTIDIPSHVSSINSLFIARSAANQTKGIFLKEILKTDLIPLSESEEYYRDLIINTNKEIEEMEVQDVSIRQSIEDLKEKISDDEGLKRLTDMQDLLRRVEGQKAALKRQVLHLEFLSNEAQSQELPYNFAKRELELTSQLSELAAIAKQVESQEVDNQDMTDLEIEEMLEVIESAKGYDLEVLEARIRGLEQRLKLGSS